MNRRILLSFAVLGVLILSAIFLYPYLKGGSSSKREEGDKKTQEYTVIEGKAAKKYLERGNQITATAFKTMAGKVKAEIKKGGPTAAIKLCSNIVQKMTAEIGKKFSVELSRVSHRPRNPKNRADQIEMKIIENYINSIKAGKKLKPLVIKRKNKIYYYSPIILAFPLCTKCHGQPNKEISPETLKLIKKLYPKDRATGFKIGELRGLWKIAFAEKGPEK